VSGEAWRKEAEDRSLVVSIPTTLKGFQSHEEVETYLAISDILDNSTHRLARLWNRGVISTLSDAAVDKARSNDPRCTSRPTTSSGVVLEPTHQLYLSLLPIRKRREHTM
jgi:hypothetical protein